MIEIEKPRIECIGLDGRVLWQVCYRAPGARLRHDFGQFSAPSASLLSARYGGHSIRIAACSMSFPPSRRQGRRHRDCSEHQAHHRAPPTPTNPRPYTIEASGECEVTAGTSRRTARLRFSTLSCTSPPSAPDASLSIELTVDHGRGYVPADKNKGPQQVIGTIPVDSIYTRC